MFSGVKLRLKYLPVLQIVCLLTASDFLDDNERQHIYNVAPGESNKPLSIFRDQHSEELAYWHTPG